MYKPTLFLAGLTATLSASCAAQPASDDAIAAAADGLTAAIEDDRNALDSEMLSISNTGCITHITAKERNWDVDWRNALMLSREDTFIFVKAPPVQLAIVADMAKPGQSEKLDKLALAMAEVAEKCMPAEKIVEPDEIIAPPLENLNEPLNKEQAN